ncbi:uncharacterized protein LOC111100125 [Crassostrea virginica]
MIDKVFDNITCEEGTANYTLSRDLQIRDEYVKCPKGMEMKTISGNESVSETVKHYCVYQNVTPVSSVIEGSTSHFIKIPDTTVAMLPMTNEFSTVGTTFDVNVEAGVYIGASVAGVVFVILVVIIGVVCRKKRLRDLLKLKLHRSRTPVSDYQYPNMPSDFHLYDVINNQAGRSTENGRF